MIVFLLVFVYLPSGLAKIPNIVVYQGSITASSGCNKSESEKQESYTNCAIECAKTESCQFFYLPPTKICYYCGYGLSFSVNKSRPISYVGIKTFEGVTDPETVCQVSNSTKLSQLEDSLKPTTSKLRTTKMITSTTSAIVTSSIPPTTTTETVKSCPAEFQMFQRSGIFWCIAVVIDQRFQVLSQNTARSYCSNMGAQITGLESLEETEFLKERLTRFVSYYPWIGTGEFGIWIDGERKSSCSESNNSSDCTGILAYNFRDPYLEKFAGYDWYPGQPGMEDCIQMLVLRSGSGEGNGKLFSKECSDFAISVACGTLAT